MDPLYDDPQLRPLIDEYGELALEPADDPYRRLVESIVNQQLSTQSAAAIKERLFGTFDITPEAMLAADPDEKQAVGLSQQKTAYVKSAAEQFIDGELTRDTFAAMSDDDVIDELTEIHGIGVWTAKVFCIFVLGREDVFPVEDLGIRNGMQELYGITNRQDMVETAENWRPYRSIASRYLWKATGEP
jgi:DNA-3-methyladenine glycosylase II